MHVQYRNGENPAKPKNAHLRPQSQEPLPVEVLDPPPVEVIADGESVRIASATAETDTAEQSVELPAKSPQQRVRVPAVLTAYGLDDAPESIGRHIDPDGALIDVHGAATPRRITRQWVAGSFGPGGRPAGLHRCLAHTLQRQQHCLVDPERRVALV